jgi:chaperone required for assembly of F1-ATPase
MKRFYRAVTVAADPEGFRIRLDGKELRSPAKNPLLLPNADLAEAIAAEWAAQGDEIRPQSMPLMVLASTACDLVRDRPAQFAAEAGKYAETDLLCYRAEGPQELRARQQALWQPLLDWAAQRFDAPLAVTSGIVPIEQPAASLAALRLQLATLEPSTLAAVADLTTCSGSLILALAIWGGRLGAASAIEAALLDERFQAERWGEDGEALARQRAIAAAIEAGTQFLQLLRADPVAAHWVPPTLQ